MLLRQKLRRGHQRCLTSVFHAEIDAGGGHHGLAGADIPLTEPVHGLPGGHVGNGLVHAAALGPCQDKGEGIIKRRHIHRAERLHGHGFPPESQQLQPNGEEEQLLKGQPPSGDVQRLGRFREVDILIGIVYPAEAVGLPHGVRQAVRQNVGAFVQAPPDGPGQQKLAHSGSEGVDRHDAAGELPAALRLHHGAGHGLPQEGTLGPAVENVGFAHPELVFQP